MIEPTYDDRESFPVTDDCHDAPDGAVIEIDDTGWWERAGDHWRPVPAAPQPGSEEAKAETREPVGTERVGGDNLVWTVLSDDGQNYTLGHGQYRRESASLRCWPSPESWARNGGEAVYPAQAPTTENEG